MQQPLCHRVLRTGHQPPPVHVFSRTRAPPRCRWTTARAAADLPVVEIPSSQEAAVTAATQALASHLKPLLGSKGKKGFAANSGSGTRFAIELPLSDTSAAATISLVAATLSAVPVAAARGATIVYADAAAAAAARASGQARAWELQEACRQEQLSGLLLLVAPGPQDVALVEQLLEEVWVGPAAAALNPTWQSGAPGQYQGLVDSFNAVYSFLPISLQGLLRGKEGAVLREARAGGSSSSSGGSSQWRVLYQQPSGTFVQVGQMKTRPQQSDLELIFMNASAASSPLTSVVKGVKSLFSRSKS